MESEDHVLSVTAAGLELRTMDAIITWVRQESAAVQAIISAILTLGIAFSWWHRLAAETGAVVGIVSAAWDVRTQPGFVDRSPTLDRW